MFQSYLRLSPYFVNAESDETRIAAGTSSVLKIEVLIIY